MENELQNKIQELEKQVQELKNELKYEEVAHKTLLEEKKQEKRILEQQLIQKQVEITNYESQKQASDRIIQQLKNEVQGLRVERNQMNQALQEKDRTIQELNRQVKAMTDLLGQELTSQIEFPPKGQF